MEVDGSRCKGEVAVTPLHEWAGQTGTSGPCLPDEQRLCRFRWSRGATYWILKCPTSKGQYSKWLLVHWDSLLYCGERQPIAIIYGSIYPSPDNCGSFECHWSWRWGPMGRRKTPRGFWWHKWRPKHSRKFGKVIHLWKGVEPSQSGISRDHPYHQGGSENQDHLQEERKPHEERGWWPRKWVKGIKAQ